MQTHLPVYLRRNVATSLEADLINVEESVRMRAIENARSTIAQVFEAWRTSTPRGASRQSTTAGQGHSFSSGNVSVSSTPATLSQEQNVSISTPLPRAIAAGSDIGDPLAQSFVPPPEVPADTTPGIISAGRARGLAPQQADSGYGSLSRPSDASSQSEDLLFNPGFDWNQFLNNEGLDFGTGSSDGKHMSQDNNKGNKRSQGTQ